MQRSTDQQRRRLLTALGACGAAGVLGPLFSGCASLPVIRQGVSSLSGMVRIDGVPAVPGAVVGPGNVLTTGPDSQVLFVVGADAYLLRANSTLELSPQMAARSGPIHLAENHLDASDRLILSDATPPVRTMPSPPRQPSRSPRTTNGLLLKLGSLLAVFGSGPKQISTITATIGIRGTGLYLEAEPENTYFCLCYGEAELGATHDPRQREIMHSNHHNARMILSQEGSSAIRRAGMKNHTDAELFMLEQLVGRTPPFSDAASGRASY
ncbi:MAG: hypothetical protein HQL82_03910 [Magnetococcales bacterium]|nr:hypothetical protein [Magnetococcales bacterium]